ncbi:MAG: DUF1800 domain-containing protein [Bacteroidota bacterium]|nr:DUF1800 domain-containing protein [Candidatus Kapabacteria bacterium]MCX7936942.1 DUF1800 domain-containing protein [Chlorobiota bacterium]MDW8075279.1 DUF1800 domain-containing protein [Bacteroidota bacterium]
MNRRAFLGLERHAPPRLTEPLASIEPYDVPLSRDDVLHLLRRLTCGPSVALVEQLTGKRAEEAVALLLGEPGTEPPLPSPGPWVDQAQEDPRGVDIVTRGQIEATWQANFKRLQEWWIELMRTETLPAREKLTLFWSGHFTTEFTYDLGYIPPQVLYRQNLMLRRMRLGNFRMFLEEVTLDCAMLEYLGGTLNVAGTPNENYAREMMELYSTGIGWYTEGDVKEAARVLTGWKASLYSDAPAPNGIFNTWFKPSDHDIGAKQFLGVTIPARDQDTNTEYLVRTQEVRRMIEILFEQRAEAIARFMVGKLYRFFVYSNPAATDATVLAALMDVFMRNDFELRPLVQTMLTSKHFFDPANRGVQIKTPADYVVGLARQLGVTLSGAADALARMEQDLIDPPDVSGWPGYRTWISTKTFPQRIAYANQVIASISDQHAQQFIQKFPGWRTIDTCVTELCQYFLPRPISADRTAYYKSILLAGAPSYEWSSIAADAQAVGPRLRSLLRAMVKAPDFHLC